MVRGYVAHPRSTEQRWIETASINGHSHRILTSIRDFIFSALTHIAFLYIYIYIYINTFFISFFLIIFTRLASLRLHSFGCLAQVRRVQVRGEMICSSEMSKCNLVKGYWQRLHKTATCHSPASVHPALHTKILALGNVEGMRLVSAKFSEPQYLLQAVAHVACGDAPQGMDLSPPPQIISGMAKKLNTILGNNYGHITPLLPPREDVRGAFRSGADQAPTHGR
eukprot:gene6119-4400_t